MNLCPLGLDCQPSYDGPVHSDRFRYSAANCSIAGTLGVVGEKWTLLVLREAFYGVRRFDDFHTALGCARNLLATRLKTLVAQGLLERVGLHRRTGPRAAGVHAYRQGPRIVPRRGRLDAVGRASGPQTKPGPPCSCSTATADSPSAAQLTCGRRPCGPWRARCRGCARPGRDQRGLGPKAAGLLLRRVRDHVVGDLAASSVML